MDLKKRTGTWLTGAAVHALGDRYEGTIVQVIEEPVRNKWAGGKRLLEIVLVFAYGKRMVLGRSIQFALMDRFGSESDLWVGKVIIIGCKRGKRTDRETGEVVAVWSKVLLPVEGTSEQPPEREPGDENDADVGVSAEEIPWETNDD